MKQSDTSTGIMITLLESVTDLKRVLQQYLEPSYQEKYIFRIQFQAGFDKEEVQTVLENELQGQTTIEARVTSYFSEKHLGPKEIHGRHFMKNATTGTHHRKTAEATVEVIVNGDWESGDEVLNRLRDCLDQFGTISITRLCTFK